MSDKLTTKIHLEAAVTRLKTLIGNLATATTEALEEMAENISASLENYLPLSGGTVDGNLSVNGAITSGDNIYLPNGAAIYIKDASGTFRSLGVLNSSNIYSLCTGGVTNSIYVGTAAYTTGLYLRAATVYAGPKNLRVPEVQRGSVSITPAGANTPTGVSVTFDNAFSGTPLVVATPGTSAPGTYVTGVGVTGASSTDCVIYLTRVNTVSTTVYWTAVY